MKRAHIWFTLLVIIFGLTRCGGCGGDEQPPGSLEAAPASGSGSGGVDGSGPVSTGADATESGTASSSSGTTTSGGSSAAGGGAPLIALPPGNAQRVDTAGEPSVVALSPTMAALIRTPTAPNVPLHDYLPDVAAAYNALNIEFFLNYMGNLFPPQTGTSTELVKYTPAGRDAATRYLKSLTSKHPMGGFDPKSLNKAMALTHITDLQRRWYGYFALEDQNKIQLNLIETAREGPKVLFRFILTFVVPNNGRQLDGGMLLVDQSASGTNAWFIRDTVISSSASILQSGGSMVGLAFKGILRNGKTAEAIFIVPSSGEKK